MTLPDHTLPEDCEIHATVTRAFHCANHIREGQTFVFDLRGRLLADRSTANLCLGIIAKLQPALMLAQDRLAEGLHPVSPAFNSFDCFDTGIDHGGTGKVYVALSLVDPATGAEIPRPGAQAANAPAASSCEKYPGGVAPHGATGAEPPTATAPTEPTPEWPKPE